MIGLTFSGSRKVSPMINTESMNGRLRHLRERTEHLKSFCSTPREAFLKDSTIRAAVEQNDIPHLERFAEITAAFIESAQNEAGEA
jgi:hypothetical protein